MDWSYAVYQTVQTIPHARVTTYGHIASILGERILPPPALLISPYRLQTPANSRKHNDRDKWGRAYGISLGMRTTRARVQKGIYPIMLGMCRGSGLLMPRGWSRIGLLPTYLSPVSASASGASG